MCFISVERNLMYFYCFFIIIPFNSQFLLPLFKQLFVLSLLHLPFPLPILPSPPLALCSHHSPHLSYSSTHRHIHIQVGGRKFYLPQVHLEHDPQTSLPVTSEASTQLAGSNTARLEILRELLASELSVDTSLHPVMTYTPAYFLGRHQVSIPFHFKGTLSL